MDGGGLRPRAAAGRGDRYRRSAARAGAADTGRGHRRDPLPGACRRVRAPGSGPRHGAAGRRRPPPHRLRPAGRRRVGGGRPGRPAVGTPRLSDARADRGQGGLRRLRPVRTGAAPGVRGDRDDPVHGGPGRGGHPPDRRGRTRTRRRTRGVARADRDLPGEGPGSAAHRRHGRRRTGPGGRGGPRPGRLAARTARGGGRGPGGAGPGPGGAGGGGRRGGGRGVRCHGRPRGRPARGPPDAPETGGRAHGPGAGGRPADGHAAGGSARAPEARRRPRAPGRRGHR